MKGTVIQINIKPKDESGVGLPKLSVKSVEIHIDGVGDDYNYYRQSDKQGTPNRAVLLMTMDKINELQLEGWPIQPGDLGENLTIDGLKYDQIKIGQKFKINQLEIEIEEICNPCRNLRFLNYVGDRVDEFIKTMKGRRGWYARVVKEGTVKINDEILLTPDCIY